MKKALLLLITALCCSDGNTSEMMQDTAQLRGGVSAFLEKLNKVDEMIRARVAEERLPSDECWRVIIDIDHSRSNRGDYSFARWLTEQDKQELTDVGISVLWDDIVLEECVVRKYGSSYSSAIAPVVDAVEEFLNTCDELFEGDVGAEFENILTKAVDKIPCLKRMLHRIQVVVKMAMEERRVLIEDYELRKKNKVAYRCNMQRMEWKRKKQQDKNHKNTIKAVEKAVKKEKSGNGNVHLLWKKIQLGNYTREFWINLTNS